MSVIKPLSARSADRAIWFSSYQNLRIHILQYCNKFWFFIRWNQDVSVTVIKNFKTIWRKCRWCSVVTGFFNPFDRPDIDFPFIKETTFNRKFFIVKFIHRCQVQVKYKRCYQKNKNYKWPHTIEDHQCFNYNQNDGQGSGNSNFNFWLERSFHKLLRYAEDMQNKCRGGC